jgi:hypothetical protein
MSRWPDTLMVRGDSRHFGVILQALRDRLVRFGPDALRGM